MKKITFEISSKTTSSIASIIKEVNKLSCQIVFDFKNNVVTVENVGEEAIDPIIELISKNYTILSVDIDNLSEPASDSDISTQKTESVQNLAFNNAISKDALITKKITFENKKIESRMNNLLKTASWAIYNKKATEKEIEEYIITCMTEISLRYSGEPHIAFSIGDIVDVNYGSHLPGEIMGGHISAIVCNIINETMAFVVPITRLKTESTSSSFLSVNSSQDIILNNSIDFSGFALLDKGKYIRAERLNSVIGKTQPEFFKKLLYSIAKTFDFTNSIDNKDISSDKKTSNEPEKRTNSNSCVPKVGEEELALLNAIGTSLDKLDKSRPVEEQLDSFFKEIGMPLNNSLLNKVFILSSNIDKIKYENIIDELRTKSNIHLSYTPEQIKSTLKIIFKDWIKKYPTLQECPKISIISLLKVFAKRFK